jgi:hypothetical protein
MEGMQGRAHPPAPGLSESPSNCREEMLEKMPLYYAKGAEEVWLCDEAGRMEFFTARSAPLPVTASVLCPDFPPQIDVN